MGPGWLRGPPWLLERVNIQVGMGNLRKEKNLLVAQFLAPEFLERIYTNFLEIYTDGSVLDDGWRQVLHLLLPSSTTDLLILSTSSVGLHG